MKKPIYLDYQATTPMDSRVLDAMMPYLTETFGNPHSASHAFGWAAEAGVDLAREQVASLLGANPQEIIFNSGASESDNLIIKGVMERFRGKTPHMITVVTEHSAVLGAAQAAAKMGDGSVTILPVLASGLLDLSVLEKAITEDTVLISVMAVNNEIGVIQPIEKITKIAHAHGVLMHVDAAQAVGKIPINVHEIGMDFMSFTAHKFYGPKGIGATYIKQGKARMIVPQISGGDQENGLRSGTLAPALIVGLGEAARLCATSMEGEAARMATMSGYFLAGLKAVHPLIKVNADQKSRWAGNLNLAFPGLDGAVLTTELRAVALSSSSACSSTSNKPSRVLLALGLDRGLAQSSLRIGFGRMTTQEEVDFAIGEINRVITQMGGLKT